MHVLGGGGFISHLAEEFKGLKRPSAPASTQLQEKTLQHMLTRPNYIQRQRHSTIIDPSDTDKRKRTRQKKLDTEPVRLFLD